MSKTAEQIKEERPKSYLEIMADFINNGASDEEITKAFTALYRHTGQYSPKFVEKRIKIYKWMIKKGKADQAKKQKSMQTLPIKTRQTTGKLSEKPARLSQEG